MSAQPPTCLPSRDLPTGTNSLFVVDAQARFGGCASTDPAAQLINSRRYSIGDACTLPGVDPQLNAARHRKPMLSGLIRLPLLAARQKHSR